MRQELFRCLLMARVEFFDAHPTAQLTQLISVELDSLRSFVFGNVSRDRGARAVLEAVGSVLVRGSFLGDGGFGCCRGAQLSRMQHACCEISMASHIHLEEIGEIKLNRHCATRRCCLC